MCGAPANRQRRKPSCQRSFSCPRLRPKRRRVPTGPCCSEDAPRVPRRLSRVLDPRCTRIRRHRQTACRPPAHLARLATRRHRDCDTPSLEREKFRKPKVVRWEESFSATRRRRETARHLGGHNAGHSPRHFPSSRTGSMPTRRRSLLSPSEASRRGATAMSGSSTRELMQLLTLQIAAKTLLDLDVDREQADDPERRHRFRDSRSRSSRAPSRPDARLGSGEPQSPDEARDAARRSHRARGHRAPPQRLPRRSRGPAPRCSFHFATRRAPRHRIVTATCATRSCPADVFLAEISRRR